MIQRRKDVSYPASTSDTRVGAERLRVGLDHIIYIDTNPNTTYIQYLPLPSVTVHKVKTENKDSRRGNLSNREDLDCWSVNPPCSCPFAWGALRSLKQARFRPNQRSRHTEIRSVLNLRIAALPKAIPELMNQYPAEHTLHRIGIGMLTYFR